MVQDQLDPEYFEAYDSQGRSRLFGDHCEYSNDVEPPEESKNCSGAYRVGNHSDCLAERIPLVVVPIPFASDWLVKGIRGLCNNRNNKVASQSAVVSPVSAVKGERKRGFDDVDEDETMSDDHPESTTSTTNEQPTRQKTTPGSEESAEEDTTDWWPAGTCGTSMDECPVLANLCYDELLSNESTMQQDEDAPKQRPLLLNDLVSFIGVVSMNPWDADFSGQQSNTAMDCLGWDAVMAQTETVPPPSRLPRLHVLSYRKMDLDELARRCVETKRTHEMSELGIVSDKSPNGNMNNDSDDDSEVEWSGFPTQQQVRSNIPFDDLASMDAVPWMRALWLCLLSDAERRRTEFDSSEGMPKIFRAGPAERALGCVSLQLSTPDVASARSLYRDLADNLLPELCPLVTAVDLAEFANTGTTFVPRKDTNGRLTPCPLQLPRGSVLLVHCPSSRMDICNTASRNAGSKNGSGIQTNKNLESIQTILSELVQHHRIPYRFEGGVTIPFEADYRVIVITTQTQELPCTLSALTSTGAATPTPLASTPKKATCRTKPDLRQILVRGRSLNSSKDDLKFSPLLLERAQKDFLEKRKQCHKESPSSPLPGEDDFHKWLTMTRLQAKTRYARDERANDENSNTQMKGDMGQTTYASEFEPSLNDWESALKLNDDLRSVV